METLGIPLPTPGLHSFLHRYIPASSPLRSSQSLSPALYFRFSFPTPSVFSSLFPYPLSGFSPSVFIPFFHLHSFPFSLVLKQAAGESVFASPLPAPPPGTQKGTEAQLALVLAASSEGLRPHRGPRWACKLVQAAARPSRPAGRGAGREASSPCQLPLPSLPLGRPSRRGRGSGQTHQLKSRKCPQVSEHQ